LDIYSKRFFNIQKLFLILKKMKKLVIICLILFGYSCKKENKSEVKELKNHVTEHSKLLDTFKHIADANTIISVHRGGKGIENYPENCLETLKFINDSIDNAIYEIDVAKTKDNILVLMHDRTLNRTTTGNGNIVNYTYKGTHKYYLVDDFGNTTNFKIPLFKDVLLWAKSNEVILTIDIKRSVDVEDVVDLIRQVGAEDNSILITYDLKQAELANAIAPELLLSVSARNNEEFDWLLRSGIPTENMVAFTGTRLSSEMLYGKIHSYGIKTILGTLGNLDKSAEKKGDKLYRTWVNKGIDIIATDRPFAVAQALN